MKLFTTYTTDHIKFLELKKKLFKNQIDGERILWPSLISELLYKNTYTFSIFINYDVLINIL